jgi:hypothetical protein
METMVSMDDIGKLVHIHWCYSSSINDELLPNDVATTTTTTTTTAAADTNVIPAEVCINLIIIIIIIIIATSW